MTTEKEQKTAPTINWRLGGYIEDFCFLQTLVIIESFVF